MDLLHLSGVEAGAGVRVVEMKAAFTYLSLGAGVQSSAMLLMSDLGILGCPRAEVALFADTKAEPEYVYRHLDALRKLSTIPIVTVSAGDLYADSIGGGVMRLPAFSENGGMVRRQCTREYKIAPLQKWVREHLGYTKGQRVKHHVRCLVGISVDEIQRAKPSIDKWVDRLHPLIDADLRRRDCLTLLASHEWPVPGKSSCVFCPYHDDAMWRDLRDNHPEDFQRAVEFDAAFRNSTKAGISNPVFVHRSLKPLGEVKFKPAHTTPLFDSFSDECEGLCGV